MDRNSYVERIYAARNKDVPGNFELLDARRLDDIKNHRIDPNSLLPRQEPGTKPACAIPYDARVNATVTNTEEGKALMVRFDLDGKLQKTKTVGMPFIAICRTPYGKGRAVGRVWNFAAREGEPLTYSWPMDEFTSGEYHLEVYGPNGFYREFKGRTYTSAAPLIHVDHHVVNGTPHLVIQSHPDSKVGKATCIVTSTAYDREAQPNLLKPGVSLNLDLQKHHGWYDITIRSEEDPSFYQRYAGHIETGRSSRTDPLMGAVIQ